MNASFRIALPHGANSAFRSEMLHFKSLDEARLIHKEESITWLSLDSADGRARYLDHWQRSRNRRPHDHPAYLDLVKPNNYTAAAVIYRHGEDASVTYPFFWCEINQFAPFRGIQRPLRHLLSPYGYGGPLYEGDITHKEAVSRAFERALHAELRDRSFVSEFVREDIFQDRLVQRSVGTTDQFPNVLVKLDRSEQEIWSGYRPAVRRNVTKASRNGLRVVFDPAGKQLDCFTRIYYDTMTRRHASHYYYFTEQAFLDLNASLAPEGAIMFAHALDGDEVVSSELVLLSGTTMYSFLSASLESAFAKRPNNLLKHEIALWGKRNGYRWLVLGGGRTPDDELLRYKRSFDPEHMMPYTMRRIIHSPEDYRRLVEMARVFSGKNVAEASSEVKFFPEYLGFRTT